LLRELFNPTTAIHLQNILHIAVSGLHLGTVSDIKLIRTDLILFIVPYKE